MRFLSFWDTTHRGTEATEFCGESIGSAAGADVVKGIVDGFNHSSTVAAKAGHTQIVEFLLARGASARNGLPLHAVIRGRHHDEVSVFIETGPSRLAILELLLNRRANVNENVELSGTPLHVSASRGGFGMRPLLMHGGDPNATKPRNGETPLHDLCRSIASPVGDPVAAARMLIDHGADPKGVGRAKSTPAAILLDRLKDEKDEKMRIRAEQVLALL